MSRKRSRFRVISRWNQASVSGSFHVGQDCDLTRGRHSPEWPGALRVRKWSHGQSDCDVCDHRIRAHSFDVTASADDTQSDRKRRDRSGPGGRLGCASACAQSRQRQANAGPRRVPPVPAPDRRRVRCGDQHHDRRIADSFARGAAEARSNFRAPRSPRSTWAR